MKQVFISQSSRKMAKNDLEALEDEVPKVNDCKHREYCNIKKFGNINCLFEKEECQTFKFYERYGENYNQLGIGAI